MRLEYKFELTEVDLPRFSVEAVEGIAKVFTLSTLVLNVLSVKNEVELVFHGLNPGDPSRKLDAFKRIISGASSTGELIYKEGEGGAVPGSSSYYQWVRVQRSA
jgi:hypothetical protein